MGWVGYLVAELYYLSILSIALSPPLLKSDLLFFSTSSSFSFSYSFSFNRAIRDDHMCAEKYGDDWKEYKKKVPYMFIPFVI
jgi:protein-S-isoprenylcysteine O-methyltransferase Ste14